jgi:hypothetical protein
MSEEHVSVEPQAYERKNQNKRDTNFLNVVRGEEGVA